MQKLDAKFCHVKQPWCLFYSQQHNRSTGYVAVYNYYVIKYTQLLSLSWHLHSVVVSTFVFESCGEAFDSLPFLVLKMKLDPLQKCIAVKLFAFFLNYIAMDTGVIYNM